MTENSSNTKKQFRVALIQLCSGIDIKENISEAEKRITIAKHKGAQLVLTPEQTILMEFSNKKTLALSGPEENNPYVNHFASLAKKLEIYLLIGSMSVVQQNSSKLYNRSFLFSPKGLEKIYDKIHLFDTDLPNGESYRESEFFNSGKNSAIAKLPWGSLGMTICYDLRFPHLFRHLAKKGADFIAVPSAFTEITGKAHWETLLRARAIENGCYIFAPAQAGKHANGRKTFGHSIIVSPWGEVIAQAKNNQKIIIADIDTQNVAKVRQQIPSLQNEVRFD